MQQQRLQREHHALKSTLHDWSGQLINTQIMGAVLEEAGYNVEYVQADYIALFAELESAYQRNAPIVLWLYVPHWAPAKYEGEQLVRNLATTSVFRGSLCA